MLPHQVHPVQLGVTGSRIFSGSKTNAACKIPTFNFTAAVLSAHDGLDFFVQVVPFRDVMSFGGCVLRVGHCHDSILATGLQ